MADIEYPQSDEIEKLLLYLNSHLNYAKKHINGPGHGSIGWARLDERIIQFNSLIDFVKGIDDIKLEDLESAFSGDDYHD